MKMIVFNLWSALQWYLRPFIKWFLRKTTRLCELQRICYGDKAGASRTCNVEQSLMLSRTTDIKQVVSYLDTAVSERIYTPDSFRETINASVSIIVRTKQVNPKLHGSFVVSLRRCIEQIWSYRSLLNEVEDLRQIQFDSNDQEHEAKLLRLWSTLVPNEPLENRITKQWQDIGFQVKKNILVHFLGLDIYIIINKKIKNPQRAH